MADIDRILGGYMQERIPTKVPDFENVRARARRHSRTRTAAAAVGTIAFVASGIAVVVGVQPGGPEPTIAAISAPPSDPSSVGVPGVVASPSTGAANTRTGGLPDGGDRWCVENYSPPKVAKRPIAFDGTVVRIGPGPSSGPEQGKLTYAAVTFAVSEWFQGGASPRMIANMTPPTIRGAGEVVPPYAVGSRLLVSGEPEPGTDAAKSFTASVCGFTRYYDAKTASAWRQAMP